MKIDQIPEVIEIAEKIEHRLLTEMSKLIQARDVPFAIAVYTTALTKVIGGALALSKDEGLRKATHAAVNAMIGAAITDAGVIFATDEAIRKASKA